MNTKDCLKIQQQILQQGKQWLYDREKRPRGESQYFISDCVGGQLWILKRQLDKKINIIGLKPDFDQFKGNWVNFYPIYCLSRNMQQDINTCWNGVIYLKDEDLTEV